MKKAMKDVLIMLAAVALSLIVLAVAVKISTTDVAPASSPYQYIIEVDGTVYECQDFELTTDESGILLYRCRSYTKAILLKDYTELHILVNQDNE